MLAVARGLMARPRVLMVDEPSLGLAPVMVDELYALLAELRNEGLTLVIVEQYVNIGLHFADRAYVIHKGEVAVTAPTAELVGSPELVEIYMAQGEAGDRDPAGTELASARSRSSGRS